MTVVLKFKTDLTCFSGDTLKVVLNSGALMATAYIKRKGKLRFMKVGTVKESEK